MHIEDHWWNIKQSELMNQINWKYSDDCQAFNINDCSMWEYSFQMFKNIIKLHTKKQSINLAKLKPPIRIIKHQSNNVINPITNYVWFTKIECLCLYEWMN